MFSCLKEMEETETKTVAEPPLRSEIDRECPICYECLPLISFSCSHKVCNECAKKLRQPICPICRSPLTCNSPPPLPAYTDTLIPPTSPIFIDRRRRRRRRRRWDNRVRNTTPQIQPQEPQVATARNDANKQRRRAMWGHSKQKMHCR